MRAIPLATVAVAVALASAACAGRNTIARGHTGAGAVRDVLLLPLNVVVDPPPGLEDAAPFVEQEMHALLDAHGKRVRTLAREDADAAWLESAQALRAEVGSSEMGFDGAAAILARRLHALQPFDALVLPWIALRPAKVRGRTVTWDGVERTLRVVNPQGRSLKILRDFQANAAAPSLQLAVFSPDGRRIFDGVGGLDLLHALVLEGEPTRIDAELLPRAQIFADRTAIQEGVETAFDPFLPRSSPQTPSTR